VNPPRRPPAGILTARGDGAISAALIAPVIASFLGVAYLIGTLTVTAGSVQDAADNAARQASLARTPAAAQTAARAMIDQTLAGDHITCAPLNLAVDTSGFAVPVGQDANVTVTVTCRVPLGHLGIPGARTLTATSISPLDRFRTR
jgi:Flp pilus assembly protein TadG